MKAVQFSEYGGPEVLSVTEVDDPHAGPGQIRIATRAAGVNAMDWKMREGYMKDLMPLQLPAGSGADAAGVVDEVGEGVEGVAVGDAVFGSGASAYAERVVLDHWAAKPQGLSFEEAAGYPVPVETALRILREVGIQTGQTLLVSGASGGVGSSVVQFAVDRGITVIATAGEKNQDYLRGLGATATTYGDGLVERVRALAPDGVDAALDIAGSGVIDELIELTGDPQKVLSIADFGAGEKGAKVSTSGSAQEAAYAEAAQLFEAGKFSLPVEQTFSLEQAADAQDASRAGHAKGRSVITV
ncbi:NADP-dependent oxidoreductase [Allobranchiibius sp. GilTou38]|uniref:NADP-dependent oxidoreductase n=1 Tax=Allobranchiibius sp. GilTou38 TaxID=2815210 RepID=UPI001AA0D69D|nr:NADP-dependent oxidoreductase [Allobranchiibius sp. GilTou38]MBO1765304.1 NADP-dependent oxidoreductase [Allobranchiibius sp. GilTou38]